MPDILPESAQLWIFLTASLALGLTPGPDMILVIARSLGLGFRAGVISMLGISLGGVVHIVAFAFGISLILIEVPALGLLVLTRFGTTAGPTFESAIPAVAGPLVPPAPPGPPTAPPPPTGASDPPGA